MGNEGGEPWPTPDPDLTLSGFGRQPPITSGFPG